MSNIVIGIEGLVGSGKTAICRELLKKIPNSIVLHGGNLYRGAVYALMCKNKKIGEDINNIKNDLKDIDISEIMKKLKVEFKLENRETVVYVDGKKVNEEDLQSDKASMAVSMAGNSADNSNLFIYLRKIIDNYKKQYNVIVSGRAIMEIYPDVDYHFFITASLEERVKRKRNQYNKSIPIEELTEHIKQRDILQEKAGFYKKYSNTITIDVTNCKTVEESTNEVCKYLKEFAEV